MTWQRPWRLTLLALCLTACAAVGSFQHEELALWQQMGLPAASEILSPNVNERPPGAKITCIVLHHTHRAKSAMETARYFQSPASQVSAHYVVDRDGAIVRCVPDGKRAWHAGVSRFQGVDNVNDYAIGIEIANKGDNVEPYPPVQMRSVIRLVAWLMRVHDVPPERITRHRDVALPAGRKDDPSDNFDFAGLIGAVSHPAPMTE